MKNIDPIPTILAIDTSCDDTSVAVTQGVRVLSNIVASQEEIHRKYGGVMPLEAKLAHHEYVNPTYQEALKRAGVKPEEIDAIAVTQGPGLAIALEVGIEFAKQVARELKKPLIGVNHMAGHMYSPLAVNSKGKPQPEADKLQFPALALLVSGGHTEMVILNDINMYNLIGKTLDDAAGEALDKFARLLDLGYPGAAVLEEIAREGDETRFEFPVPMMKNKDLNFSFSGLKTAGRQLLERVGERITKQDIADLAASFEKAVFTAIIYKLNRAIVRYQPKSLWFGGGVSANLKLRRQLRNVAQLNNLAFHYPKLPRLHGDNAAMIGIAAYFTYKRGEFVKDFEGFQRIPRLSLP